MDRSPYRSSQIEARILIGVRPGIAWLLQWYALLGGVVGGLTVIG